jgi:hypothetical protein
VQGKTLISLIKIIAGNANSSNEKSNKDMANCYLAHYLEKIDFVGVLPNGLCSTYATNKREYTPVK